MIIFELQKSGKSSVQLKHWALVFICALLIRLAASWLLQTFDIYNDSGIPIKFLGQPAYNDYQIYQQHIHSAWASITMPIEFVANLLKNPQEAWQWLRLQPFKPGPLFISMLDFSEYDTSRLALSWFYMLLGLMLGLIWAHFIAFKGVCLLGQLLVGCFPALIYYSILVSTDLLYAFIVTIFYGLCLYSLNARLSNDLAAIALVVICLVIALLIRPNALALIPVVGYVILVQVGLKKRFKLLWALFLAVIGSYMLVYYAPYFWLHEKNSAVTRYWGILPSDYQSGLFSVFPEFLDQALSITLLILSKLLYSVGLRPSYANMNYWIVLIRALPGVVFLPGLIYVFLYGVRFDKVFMLFFLLPVYVGAAQERYLLAVTPLLILYGFKAYNRLFSRLENQGAV